MSEVLLFLRSVQAKGNLRKTDLKAYWLVFATTGPVLQVFVAYKLVCLLCPTKQATKQVVGLFMVEVWAAAFILAFPKMTQ